MKKKITRRIIALFLLLLMLPGCGGSESQVKNFGKALKKLDYDGMCACFEEDMMTEEDFTYMLEEYAEMGLEDIYAAHAKNIDFTIGETVMDEDDDEYAEVSVTLGYDDYAEGITQAFNTYYQEFFADDDGTVGEERLAELLREHFENDSYGRKEEEVIFYCEKLEGKWVISYDYDMLERVCNAISCNLIDTSYDYDFDFEEDDEDWDTDDDVWYEDLSDELVEQVLEENGVVLGEDEDISDYEYLFEDYIEDDEEEWEEWDEDAWENEELYDSIMDRLYGVESSGAMLLRNYTMEEMEEDDVYYILTGDVYDYDVYTEYQKILAEWENFAETYPEIYEDMDDGLYAEEMDVYIPVELDLSGKWPSGSSSYESVAALLGAGADLIYTGDLMDEAEEVYEY